MKAADVHLALYRFYAEASDGELADLNVSRHDVFWLCRHFDSEAGEYRTTELTTIAQQIIKAYRAGFVKDK